MVISGDRPYQGGVDAQDPLLCKDPLVELRACRNLALCVQTDEA